MKKIVKDPAFYIVLGLCLMGVVIFLVLNKETKQGYLLFSNVANFVCTEEDCKAIESEKIVSDSSKGKFLVYENETKQGLFTIDYITKWNFFDDSGNWVNISDSFIAANENLNLENKVFTTRTINNEEKKILDKFLQEKNISSYTSLEQNEVVEHDFNNDGKKEKIMILSNVNDTTEDEKLFVFVIGIVGNKTSLLFSEIYNQYENYEVPIYQIKGIINIFQNKEDYLAILKGYFSEVGKSDIILYKVEKNDFQNLVVD